MYTIDYFQARDLSRKYSVTYFGQFHYGVFYAFLKLKEQEIKNLRMLADLIMIQKDKKNSPAFKRIVPPFQWNADEEE